MSSPFATPKKPATGALLHPPGSAVGIARAAVNEAQGKGGIEAANALMRTGYACTLAIGIGTARRIEQKPPTCTRA